MKNDIYFDGKYFDSATITEQEEVTIHEKNPAFYTMLSKNYGLKRIKVSHEVHPETTPEVIPEVIPEVVKKVTKKK